MSELRFLAKDTRLFLNTGTKDTPVWSRVSTRGQLGVRKGTVETDVTAEDSGNEEETQVVLIARSLEFEIFVLKEWEDDDIYLALDAASEAMDVVEFAVATGAIAEPGTRYRRCPYQLTQFDDSHNVKEVWKANVTAKKCPGGAAQTVTVSA